MLCIEHTGKTLTSHHCVHRPYMSCSTWLKVFRIDTEFCIGEVARGHFCKCCKSEEKFCVSVWGGCKEKCSSKLSNFRLKCNGIGRYFPYIGIDRYFLYVTSPFPGQFRCKKFKQ